MDSIGGTLKNCIYQDVFLGKCVIGTMQQLADHTNNKIIGIASLYLLEE